MKWHRDCGWGKTRRWLRHAGLAACVAAGLAAPGWSQFPSDEMVTPEKVTALVGRLETLDAVGQSAVLDFLVEAANKPSDRGVTDAMPLQVAVRRIGPEIAKLATSPDANLRRQALTALGQIRANSEIVAPAWEKALAERDAETDRAVGKGMLAYLKRGQLIRDSSGLGLRLAFIDAETTDFLGVAALLPRLQRSADASARLAAYEGVASFFDTVENIAPELRADANPQAFASYKRALPQLPEQLAGFFAVAAERLRAAPPAEARQILISLEKVAEVSISRDDLYPTKFPRRQAGRLLQADLEPQGRDTAKLLVAELRKQLAPAVGQLRSPDLQTRLALANFVEATGPEAEAVLPALIAGLNDPSPFVRWALIRTLGKLGIGKPKDSDAIVAALIPCLSDKDMGVRGVAALAVEQYGERAAAAAPALSEMAKQQDAVIQLLAVQALGAVGPAAKEALPGLAAALTSQDERVRELVPPLLGRLGPAAAPAVPALRKALQDSSASVRLRAAEALVRIQAP